MGLFTLIGALAAPVMKKVATVVVPVIAGTAVSFIKKKFNDILGNNKNVVENTTKTLGETEAYDIKTASFEDTMSINEKLEKIKKNYLEIAEVYEILSHSDINNQLDRVKAKIENINKVKNNLIDRTIIKRIEEESARLQEDISGTYANEIIKLTSLGNAEILEVLKKKSGKEKEIEIEKLLEKYMKNASSKLLTKLEKHIDKQIDFIQDILNTYFSNLKNREENLKAEIEEVNKALSEGKEKELEKEYLKTLSLLESIN